MFTLKVRKFGDSLGVVLPEAIINRLHTGDGQTLCLIEVPDGGYLITPYNPSSQEKMAKDINPCEQDIGPWPPRQREDNYDY